VQRLFAIKDEHTAFYVADTYYLTAQLRLITVPSSKQDRLLVNLLTPSIWFNALSAMAAARAAARRRARANAPESGDRSD